MEDEISQIRTRNQELRDEIKHKDAQIAELVDKLSELSKQKLNFNFNFSKEDLSFEEQLQQYYQHLVNTKQNELDQINNEKQLLLKMIQDQEQCLKEQENKIESHCFKKQRTYHYSYSKPQSQFKNPKQSSKISEFIKLQDEIQRINEEIITEKKSLNKKRANIQRLKEMSSDIPSLRKKIEEKQEKTANFQEIKNRIEIMKQRINDHKSFLLQHPDQLKRNYETFKDILDHQHTRNLQILQDYQTFYSQRQNE